MFSQLTLPTDAFNIRFIQQGSGPPLILVHGGGTWSYSFRHNICDLSRQYSVYAIDVPGHGYTRPRIPDPTYDLETVCSNLLRFLDRLNIPKAHMAGHSWGGGFVLDFARRHPKRVDRLILIDSSGVNRWERLEWELLKWPLIGKLLTRLVSAKQVRKGLERTFSNPDRVTAEMVQAIYAPLAMPAIRKAQQAYMRNIDWRPLGAALPHISHPVLIIWGKHDLYIHVRYGRQMGRCLPNASLIVLDHCGHSPHEEDPQTVNRLILDFLSGDVSAI